MHEARSQVGTEIEQNHIDLEFGLVTMSGNIFAGSSAPFCPWKIGRCLSPYKNP